MKYVCEVCGWEYDEAEGCPEKDIAQAASSSQSPSILSEQAESCALRSFIICLSVGLRIPNRLSRIIMTARNKQITEKT
jgi:hypothetical protein